MLTKLTIKNIALIDYVEIDFSKGLNVLSGETGSGKSVIIESLNFVLGEKADRSFIRSGESECCVVAEFDITTNSQIKSIIKDLGLEYDDTLILSRKFNVEGRGAIKLNGETVTVSMLKKITSNLVDVFGQSEHFFLLSETNQLNMIDCFGDEEISSNKTQLKEKFDIYKKTCTKLDELGGDESHRLMRLDVLNYQINEITQCDLKEGEEEKLNEIRQNLIYKEKIFSAFNQLKSGIDDEGGVSDILSNSSRSVFGLINLSEEYSRLYERVESLIVEAGDIAGQCSDILLNFEDSEYNPDEIETRLSIIKKLKQKYGADYNEINNFLSSAIEEKEQLENFNEIAEKLLIDKSSLENDIYLLYKDLSQKRRKYADIFSKQVITELRELGMDKADFCVQFDEIINIENCKFSSPNGIDNMKFLFSANLGEPLKPLSSVISGGELSRFMLAIKAQTSKYNNISTFIFDEIDTGISGKIAMVVAEKFAKIAKDVQIIAITHLPQISAMADNNMLISKSETDGKTHSHVKILSNIEKIDEIIRLIGGQKDSKSAREYSEDLINQTEKFKKSL